MDGKIQILKRLELFLGFVSLWVLYTNQEFGCTGLLILCTTLSSLDSLWQELDFCCWISSCILKTTNILAMILMIPIGIDFLKSETLWICWKKVQHSVLSSWAYYSGWEPCFVQRKARFQTIHKVKKVQVWNKVLWIVYSWWNPLRFHSLSR